MAAMISYSRHDRDVADELSRHLQSHNVPVWIDHQQIAQGAQWRDELLNQLRQCDAFIPLISSHYMSSEHCRMELLIARSFDRRIIPVMLDESWGALARSEATKSLDDLFILNLGALNVVGYPVDRDDIFRRVAVRVKAKRPVETSGHVYFVYLEQDAVLATDLARELTQSGIPTWIASVDTVAGDNWRKSQVRAMHRAACQFIILNEGITKNEFVATEVLMAEAIGIPVFMAFHPDIRGDEGKIAMLNTELKQGELPFRRVFDRNAFVIQAQPPRASRDMIGGFRSITHRRRRWPSFKW